MQVLAKYFIALTHEVTSNISEKGINSILDTIGVSKDIAFIEELYTIALNSLKANGNEVL
jgi:hypothetical protein